MKNHSKSRQPHYLGWFFNWKKKKRGFISLFYSTPNQCDQLFPIPPALSSTDSQLQLQLLTQKSTRPFLVQEPRNSLNAISWGRGGSCSTNLVSLFSRILETTVDYALWGRLLSYIFTLGSHLVVVSLGYYNSAFTQQSSSSLSGLLYNKSLLAWCLVWEFQLSLQ